MTRRLLAPAAALLVGLGSAGAAMADTAPKPSMSFAFTFDKPGLTIVKGVLFQCEDAHCATGGPLERLGPQGFDCDATQCSADAYGFFKYTRLEITFSDGRTLKSNVFTDDAFDANYRVVVGAAALSVQPVE